MKRLFSRSPRENVEPLGVGTGDAHGCPLCPHPPAAGLFEDDDGGSTLLPLGEMALDGRTLRVAEVVEFDGDGVEVEAEFELD